MCARWGTGVRVGVGPLGLRCGCGILVRVGKAEMYDDRLAVRRCKSERRMLAVILAHRHLKTKYAHEI